MSAGAHGALEKTFVVEPVHNGQHRCVSKTSRGTNCVLYIAHGDGRAVPDGFHNVEFQRSQHHCEPISSIISRAASFPGAWDGMERMRKVNCRRGNRMEIVSPTRTSRPAFASCPLTITRPASQVSLAKLRRKITRLHFKNKSRRIRSKFGVRRVNSLFLNCKIGNSPV